MFFALLFVLLLHSLSWSAGFDCSAASFSCSDDSRPYQMPVGSQCVLGCGDGQRCLYEYVRHWDAFHMMYDIAQDLVGVCSEPSPSSSDAAAIAGSSEVLSFVGIGACFVFSFLFGFQAGRAR